MLLIRPGMFPLPSGLEHHRVLWQSEVQPDSSDGLEPNGPEASVRDSQWYQSLHAQELPAYFHHMRPCIFVRQEKRRTHCTSEGSDSRYTGFIPTSPTNGQPSRPAHLPKRNCLSSGITLLVRHCNRQYNIPSSHGLYWHSILIGVALWLRASWGPLTRPLVTLTLAKEDEGTCQQPPLVKPSLAWGSCPCCPSSVPLVNPINTKAVETD